MAETKIALPTWRCPACNYAQDYPPTAALHDVYFAGLGLQDNDCPACHTGRNPQRQKAPHNGALMPDAAAPSMATVMGPEAIDNKLPVAAQNAQRAQIQHAINSALASGGVIVVP